MLGTIKFICWTTKRLSPHQVEERKSCATSRVNRGKIAEWETKKGEFKSTFWVATRTAAKVISIHITHYTNDSCWHPIILRWIVCSHEYLLYSHDCASTNWHANPYHIISMATIIGISMNIIINHTSYLRLDQVLKSYQMQCQKMSTNCCRLWPHSREPQTYSWCIVQVSGGCTRIF